MCDTKNPFAFRFNFRITTVSLMVRHTDNDARCFLCTRPTNKTNSVTVILTRRKIPGTNAHLGFVNTRSSQRLCATPHDVWSNRAFLLPKNRKIMFIIEVWWIEVQVNLESTSLTFLSDKKIWCVASVCLNFWKYPYASCAWHFVGLNRVC